MTIWKSITTKEEGEKLISNTIIEHLGIEVIDVGDDYIKATMPVDHRTYQPMQILHGGASVVLAETIGSIAAHMACEPGAVCVGLEINANHIRSVTGGIVTGVGKPIHIGKTTQVWDIKIYDEENRIVCVSRITMAVLNE